jgi:hypothetical protein
MNNFAAGPIAVDKPGVVPDRSTGFAGENKLFGPTGGGADATAHESA